jgi:hypothetical protein
MVSLLPCYNYKIFLSYCQKRKKVKMSPALHDSLLDAFARIGS